MKQPSSSFLTPDSIFFLPSLLLLVPCVCSDNDLFIPNKSIRCISLVPPPLPSKCHHSISQTSPSSLCSLQVVYRQAALLYPFPSAFTPCPPWLPHSPLFLPSPLHSPLLFIQWTSTRSLSMPRTNNAFIYSTTTTFSISLSLSSFIPSRFALIFFNPLLHKKWYNAFKRAIFLSNTAVSYV